MKVRYRNLSVVDPVRRQRLLAAVEQVLKHGRIILGPEVEQFEACLSAQCGRRFAVGLSSGTDALYVALRALNVGPGDEVITTPLSWIATVNAIVLCGARPVFADIGPDLNLDPGRVEEQITPRTRAILPVHFTGRLCDMDRIGQISRHHGLPVVEDAAQAYGATAQGKPVGACGRLACFSLNAMKNLRAYGEAGCVLTDDQSLRDRMRILRHGGTVGKQDCHYPSLNFRIDTIQAAMLMVEMDYVPAIIARRREIARIYGAALADWVRCPLDEAGHTYYAYTILAPRREALMAFLAERGVETKIQHQPLMPYHAAYEDRWPRPDIPVAEGLVGELLCLPNDEKMSDGDLFCVIDAIKAFYGVADSAGR